MSSPSALLTRSWRAFATMALRVRSRYRLPTRSAAASRSLGMETVIRYRIHRSYFWMTLGQGARSPPRPARFEERTQATLVDDGAPAKRGADPVHDRRYHRTIPIVGSRAVAQVGRADRPHDRLIAETLQHLELASARVSLAAALRRAVRAGRAVLAERIARGGRRRRRVAVAVTKVRAGLGGGQCERASGPEIACRRGCP